jgi:hypothetical protein
LLDSSLKPTFLAVGISEKRNFTLSDAFTHIFVEIFFNYRKFISDGNTFRVGAFVYSLDLISPNALSRPLLQLRDFVNSQKSISYRKFLVKFQKTVIFKEFINSYTENSLEQGQPLAFAFLTAVA